MVIKKIYPTMSWVDANFLIIAMGGFHMIQSGSETKLSWVLTAFFFISPINLSSSFLERVFLVWLFAINFFCWQCFYDMCYVHWYRVYSIVNCLTITFECLLNITIAFLPNTMCLPFWDTAGNFFSLEVRF